MAIWNLGSINADLVYTVPHIPAPGETLSSTNRATYMGGKGANMSVAIARAGSRVNHIGALGPDGGWAVQRLLEYGVDTRHIAQVETATGHAIIMVDAHGENAILCMRAATAKSPSDPANGLGRGADGRLVRHAKRNKPAADRRITRQKDGPQSRLRRSPLFC